MLTQAFTNIRHYLTQGVSIAPLVVFRIVFGLSLLFSALRFLALGWAKEQYILPKFHFTYYGFEWVQPLGTIGMYILFGLLIVSAIGIIIGYLYQFVCAIHFLVFTYIELIDKTYYLNHYYFVSLVCFLLIFLPANRLFSLDAKLNPAIETLIAPAWMIDILKLQLGLVYVYAGLAKINADWLLDAMPLRIWLPANDHLPILGPLFRYEITAYLFSWGGMVYDICIPFLLLHKVTRPWAFPVLLAFHGLTGWLFQIGVFPLVMSSAAIIFFDSSFHEKIIKNIKKVFSWLTKKPVVILRTSSSNHFTPSKKSEILFCVMIIFFVIQILVPWRYLLYPGNLFWTEEGYRFSWRVMLVEKAGNATFYVKNPITGKEGIVANEDFLNTHQIKQMSFQPDMILQFANYLADHYESILGSRPQVRAEVFVTMNGSRSKLLIDPHVDLAKEQENLKPKKWILPFGD